MIKEFKLPDIGEGITEAEIVNWLVKVGDPVQEHQDMVEIETDKALVTLPSPYGGKIVNLHGREGHLVKVGETLASVEVNGGTSAPEPRASQDQGTVVGSLGNEEPAVPLPPAATPAVRALAKELKVDLRAIKGTGPGGRVTKEDVEQAARKVSPRPGTVKDAPGAVERIPLRGIRRTVAKRMAEASKRVAEVTIWEDADITELENVRAKEKKVAEDKGIRLTYLPFVIKAVLPALKAHPYLNSMLDDQGEEIVLKKYYNIGIAVDTTDGLIVFVVKDADQKTILELAGEVGVLAGKARERKLDISELKGSTFTITNYGVIGASYGTPIINYPEVGILGMGKIEDKAVVREGQIVVRRILPLSLAFDHRVIDGVEAARFLNVVIRHLEDPNLMLLGSR